MERFLMQLWEMSWQAGLIVLVVLAARLLFGWMKVPKQFAYALWLIPFIRMVCPWSVESVWSLMPKQQPSVSGSQLQQAVYYVRYGEAANTVTAAAGTAETMQEISSGGWQLILAGGIWAVGLVLLCVYSAASYVKLKKSLICCVALEDGVYLADGIHTAFVVGVFRPVIYLPSDLSEQEMDYVIAHERVHIRRKDYWIKPIAFFITCVHWFNPLAWIAFWFMGKDMEMSCDEAVLKQLGAESREAYASTLLQLTAGKNRLSGVPLAFGEGNTGHRIKNIMKYKKPLVATAVIAVVLIILLAVCLLTNPVSSDGTETDGSFSLEDAEDGTYVEVTPATISGGMELGADGPILDYADEQTVIYHGYFGLFVYSLSEQRFVGSVDLEAIGCSDTQGEHYCEVYAASDGLTVYLHPTSEDMMYVYDVQNNQLICRKYDMAGIECFENLQMTSECVEADPTVFRSQQCAAFSDSHGSYYGYLESGSGLLADLCYMEGDTRVNFYEGEISCLYYMKVADETLTSTGLTLDIYNNSNEEIEYGEDYILRRKVDDTWVDVPYILTDWGFEDIAYVLSAGEMRAMEIDWEWLYGELEPGTYMLVKSTLIRQKDGSYLDLSVEFEIK